MSERTILSKNHFGTGPAAEIKNRLQWVALYTEFARDCAAQSQEADDAMHREANEWYAKRNDLMREIHRLADELEATAR